MKLPESSSRLAALLLVLAGVGLVAVFGRDRIAGWLAPGSAGPAAAEAEGIAPPGFWHRVPPRDAGGQGRSADAEERARLVSLPYLSGRAPASSAAPEGVTVHDRERVAPGLNLYTSGHGPEAVLMTMDGRVEHRWRYPFERAFPGMAPTGDTAFFRRARLLPDGRLAALYQTGGLVFLDRRSHRVGRCPGNFYNDFQVGEDGRIWTIAKEEIPGGAGRRTRLDDFLVLLRLRGDGEGCRVLRRISLTRAFVSSRFAGLLEPMTATGDVLHTNAVVELDRDVAGATPAFAAGNLLVSIRELDLVAVVDPASERVVWAQRGPWDAQHEPSLLSDGHVLLFDNRGAGGFSRLLEVDPRSGELTWQWTGDPPASFRSPIGGSCVRLANGNTLVTESVPGRAFELDPEGRIVWEFRTPHRAGPGGSLVAMLFEVQRLPLTSLDALSS